MSGTIETTNNNIIKKIKAIVCIIELFKKNDIHVEKKICDDIYELKEEYEMVGSEGKVTETWKLPKPIEEVRAEINELITSGSIEIEALEKDRNKAFDKLRENNMEHYL